jgi:1,4-alpha-glucan branching enzyme
MNTVVSLRPAQTAEQLTLDNIDDQTPMGANLLPSGNGATFKLWAPLAQEIDLLWDYKADHDGNWSPGRRARLGQMAGGIWAGFVPRLTSGDRYMFYVYGPEGGTEGLKRDPHARDLSDKPMWPECQCLLYNPAAFPWHDAPWQPPAFHELVIYQLHLGTWRIPAGHSHGSFLDVIEQLPYLKALGVNAIMPLPIVEFPTMFSFGYNGVDYFSPETDYGIGDTDGSLNTYLAGINHKLQAINPDFRPYDLHDIQGTANQFRMMVDMCHVYGIAVILDVVYNHAGGGFGDKSIYFFDRQPEDNINNSLYFTDHEWAGGRVFAYWKNEVKQFLIDNARYYLQECHCDGLRYDEVSVIKNEGGEHGWRFCQYVTDTCHYAKPEAIHIAEHWPVEQAVVAATAQGGAGFDATQNDGLRDAVRGAIAQAVGGASGFVDMERIA